MLNYWDNLDGFEKGFFSVIGVIIIFCFILSLLFFIGFHLETGKGEHIGYITAVETRGIFLKTNRAYIKTDIQSSQEDSYCVIDSEIKSKLEKLAENKDRVKISYFSWLSNGIKNCEGEGEVIYDVNVIK